MVVLRACAVVGVASMHCGQCRYVLFEEKKKGRMGWKMALSVAAMTSSTVPNVLLGCVVIGSKGKELSQRNGV